MTKRQLARFAEDQKKLFEFMGLKPVYRRPKSNWVRKPNWEKIPVLSDLHEPYSNEVVIDHVLEREADAGMLMIPGDIGDYYSKSRFRKTRHQSFQDELRSVFLLIERLAQRFHQVKIMIGNHDNRPEKHVYTTIGDQVDLLIMTESNMLDRLCAHFDNVELVGTQLDKSDINMSHIYQHGDIIFTHGELSLKQSSAILERIELYLNEWGTHLDLKPFKVLAQAHNHRGLKEEGEVTRFLLPTACNPYTIGMEYIYSSRMIGRPPCIGYTVFYQSNGETDTNRSHNVKFKVRHGKTQPLQV